MAYKQQSRDPVKMFKAAGQKLELPTGIKIKDVSPEVMELYLEYAKVKPVTAWSPMDRSHLYKLCQLELQMRRLINDLEVESHTMINPTSGAHVSNPKVKSLSTVGNQIVTYQRLLRLNSNETETKAAKAIERVEGQLTHIADKDADNLLALPDNVRKIS